MSAGKALIYLAVLPISTSAAGRSDVIHLEVGEPDFSTSTHIIDAAFAAARSGWTKYPPTPACQLCANKWPNAQTSAVRSP